MKIMHVCHASEFPKVRAQFMLKIPDTKVCIIKQKNNKKPYRIGIIILVRNKLRVGVI